MTQDFFTPRELAEIGLARGITSFPNEESGVRKYAKRGGWNDLPTTLARKRAGREGGGGMEYHYSLLPEIMQGAIQAAGQKITLAGRADVQAVADRRMVAALKTAGLGARSHSVMEARSEILASIEGYAISHGQSRAWGVARFLEAVAEFIARQDAEKRRDRGAILTEREIRALTRVPLLTISEGFDIGPERLATANDRRGDQQVGRSTIYGWFKARDQRGAAALAPTPPKAAQPIPAAFVDFMKFYSAPSKPTIAAAHAEYMKAVAARGDVQNEPVTLAQARHILRVRLSNLEQHVGREGLLTLKARMAYVSRATDDMWPTTIYTADGKTFDAEVADPVSRRPMKPEITSVLDVATRKCVGFAISRKENVVAVTEALRRACMEFGVPAVFYVDRGAGYKNKTFDGDDGVALGGLMGRLGITKMHALPYNSQAKGIVERFNAQWNDLARTLPTYLGRDMDKEAKSRVHKATRFDIREFGSSSLLPSWEGFLAMCAAKIAEYNDTPHGGLPRFEDPETGRLRHMTPNEAWAAHVVSGFEPVRIAAEDEDDLFRPYEVRTVRRCLITLWTNEYFNLDLEAWHEKEVYVGYDQHQADKVWVREIDRATRQPGPLICVAVFGGNRQRYISVTAEQAAIEKRAKGQMRRLGRKAEAVQDQLRAPLLEHAPSMPMPELPRHEKVILPEVGPDVAGPADMEAANRTAAPIITTDAELAKLVLVDPGQLTPGRAHVLREVMKRRNGRELMRISGVDLDALDNLLRSAA